MLRLAYDNVDQVADLVLGKTNLETDQGLETAVFISLFTDRQADPDDEIPDGTEDRRGWWADRFTEDEGDLIGSRLWLLSRSKTVTTILAQAETYAEEALDWLIEDGIASSVSATAEKLSTFVLALTIEITRPGDVAPKYINTWEVTINGLG